MSLESHRAALHEKAKNLAFYFYVRNGNIPPLVMGIIDVTSTSDVFKTALKFNPDQPRVPAGNGSESGQWTSGVANTDDNPNNLSPVPIASATSASRPASSLFVSQTPRKDPGPTPVVLNDGSTVTNPDTGKPLLMPKGVSLVDNAKIGQGIGELPIGVQEMAIGGLMWPGASMDYQRLYDDGSLNKAYVDFGNYNYGVVMAATGFSLDDSLNYAGKFNEWIRHNSDQSGVYNTDKSENTFIPMGWNDYTMGKIIPAN